MSCVYVSGPSSPQHFSNLRSCTRAICHWTSQRAVGSERRARWRPSQNRHLRERWTRFVEKWQIGISFKSAHFWWKISQFAKKTLESSPSFKIGKYAKFPTNRTPEIFNSRKYWPLENSRFRSLGQNRQGLCVPSEQRTASHQQEDRLVEKLWELEKIRFVIRRESFRNLFLTRKSVQVDPSNFRPAPPGTSLSQFSICTGESARIFFKLTRFEKGRFHRKKCL